MKNKADNNSTTPNSETFHEGLRRLTAPEHQAIGFIWAYATDATKRPNPNLPIIAQAEEIRPFTAPQEIRAFITDLISAFVDETGAGHHLPSLDYGTTPRQIIDALNETNVQAALASTRAPRRSTPI